MGVPPRFDQMTALLVGATSGIGLETAAQLAEAGVPRIIFTGRNSERGEQALSALKSRTNRTEFLFVQGDASNRDWTIELSHKLRTDFGGLHFVMNAVPGSVAPKPFDQLDCNMFTELIEQHLLSNFYLAHGMLPLLRKSGGGTYIIVSSDAAKIPTPGESLHGSLMAALNMFARTLALENARHTIRVHALTPSIVANTHSHERMMAEPFSRKLFEKAKSRAGLGVVEPSDLAALSVFLASPQAARMTGQSITVNGGIAIA